MRKIIDASPEHILKNLYDAYMGVAEVMNSVGTVSGSNIYISMTEFAKIQASMHIEGEKMSKACQELTSDAISKSDATGLIEFVTNVAGGFDKLADYLNSGKFKGFVTQKRVYDYTTYYKVVSGLKVLANDFIDK